MVALRLNSHTFPLTTEEQRIYRENGVELICAEGMGELSASDLSRADALGVVAAKIPKDVVAKLSNCRVISRYGSGVDNVDIAAATSAGIVVTNVPTFCLAEVAEHTMALLLALARKIVTMDRCTRSGEWQARVQRPTYRISGKTLGLIGFGRIGQEVARRAAAFGLRVLATDPRLDHMACARFNVVPISFDELLASSDYVSLHVPLGADTRHLIGEAELCRMKTSAFLINTARGAVVDERALEKALRQGSIAGAALDVYEDLPMFDPHAGCSTYSLFELDNVVLTPHSAGCSVEALDELCRVGAENAVEVLSGKWPANCVNVEVVPRITLAQAAK